MRWPGRSRPAAAAHDERGATLVEFAVVAPLFFALIFAVIEFGLAFNSYLGVANTSRTSARVASAMANEPEADYAVLRSVVKSSSSMVRGEIQRIVVFRAATPDSPVPADCRTATVGVFGSCNVYLPPNFADPESAYGCGGIRLDRFWCPTARKVAITGAQGPPDYIGVWVQAEHGMLTGFFGSNRTITDQTVMRIEPRRR